MVAPLKTNGDRRVRIGLDIDDVIADFWEAGIPIFNKKYGVDAKKEDFDQFDAMSRVYNITYQDFLDTIINENMFERMKPYSGVPEVVQGYREAGAEVIMVTSRGFHPNAFDLTKEFLDRHEIPFDQLHIKASGRTKDEYIDGAIDIFVDDLPDNLIDIKLSGKARRLAMIHQPWNTGVDDFPRFDHLGHVEI